MITLVNSTAVLVALGAFVALLLLSVILLGISRWRPNKSNLTIYSACYGIGSENDWDVTDILQRHRPKEGMVLRVDNDLFGRDPAPNRPKQIKLVYSYGGNQRIEVIRPEHSRLVLPEDDWLVAQTLKLTSELRAVEAERDALRSMATASDVTFGDAIQGVDTRRDPGASWWHIPITASKKLEDCTVDIEINSRPFKMLWSVGHGELPKRRINLLPNEPEVVAVVLRAERLRWGLAFEPWTVFVTDEDVMQQRYQDYSKLPSGRHSLKVLLKTSNKIISCAYQIIVPEAEIGNGHFYVRHYDGLVSPV